MCWELGGKDRVAKRGKNESDDSSIELLLTSRESFRVHTHPPKSLHITAIIIVKLKQKEWGTAIWKAWDGMLPSFTPCLLKAKYHTPINLSSLTDSGYFHVSPHFSSVIVIWSNQAWYFLFFFFFFWVALRCHRRINRLSDTEKRVLEWKADKSIYLGMHAKRVTYQLHSMEEMLEFQVLSFPN